MRVTLTALALVTSSPGLLLACPVCGLASGLNNQSSYALMSLVLSVLPLGMIAGVGFWVYRRVTTAQQPAQPERLTTPQSESMAGSGLAISKSQS
jgi:hypothetical protein